LERAGYLADEEIATACFLAMAMGRPLFCEGSAGVGKTALARAVAEAMGWPLFRLQCYEGLDASEALYAWDFPRQLLHLRAAETVGAGDRDRLEAELYDRRFLLPRAILKSFEASPSVLLIDEVDRADDEFEAFLLEALSEFSVTVPELGTITATVPPFVVLTSNRTREVHDALKRRCLYLWIDHPARDRELAILRRRFPVLPAGLAEQVIEATRRLRQADLLKPPGVAESLDWLHALHDLQSEALTPTTAALTLGAVLKYQEDQQRVRRDNFKLLLGPS
jgi:MoxR-like ATPase